MNKSKYFFIISLLFLISFVSKAQYSQPTQSVFVELGGPAIVYSFNYDFRFDKENLQSWGMRVGVGGYARSSSYNGGNNSDGLFTIPLQVTRLFGRTKHFFELGGGATFMYARSTSNFGSNQFSSKDYDFILNSGETPTFMGTLNLGYRKIPENGGFTFRANLTPVFNQNGFWPIWAGVGFGYAFH